MWEQQPHLVLHACADHKRLTLLRLSIALQEPKRRVVVTGMGVVTALGHEVDTFYNNLLDGKSGITLIEVRPQTTDG